MTITCDELKNIKKVYGFHSDAEVYKWILKTFPESVFFDDVVMMELINEAKEKLSHIEH